MPGPRPIRADRGLFITVGVPSGQRGMAQVKRAVGLLKRHGFRAGITSDEAVLAVADEIRDHEKKHPERTAIER